MKLMPRKKIYDIPSGNPYKDDFDLFRRKSLKDITFDFPLHQIFLKGGKSAEFITSIIANETIHVYYNRDGLCIGAEVMAIDSDQLKTVFHWEGIDLFPPTLKILFDNLKKLGCNIKVSDYGIEIEELGISTYSNNIRDDFECKIDTIYITFFN